MTDRIRVGFIGCGWIATTHFQVLNFLSHAKLLDTEITAAFDVDPERLKASARLKPGIKLYNNASSLLGSHDVDSVFVCTPTKSHKEYVAEAAAAGKDIFCEKPMATNLKDAEEMLRIVEKAGVKAQVGLVMRFHPLLNYTERLIDNNKQKIGPAMSIVLRTDQYFPIRGQFQSTWRKDKDITGGGTLIEHSVHDIDLMRWFFGDVAKVRASLKHFSGRDVEDQATVWLEFVSGAEGMLTSIWHELGARESRLIETFYNKGLFHLEIGDATKWMAPQFYQVGGGSPKVIGSKEADNFMMGKLGIQSKYDLGDYAYQAYSFIKSIQSNRPTHPDFSVGVYAHKIIEAAYSSARTNSTIKLT